MFQAVGNTQVLSMEDPKNNKRKNLAAKDNYNNSKTHPSLGTTVACLMNKAIRALRNYSPGTTKGWATLLQLEP